MMRLWLTQQGWWRSLFPGKFFLLADGVWIRQRDFKKGMKIEEVEGPWKSQYFCECGNCLTYSDSFIQSLESGVWEYNCTHCGKHQYANGMLGPFIIECDRDGKPLNFKKNEGN